MSRRKKIIIGVAVILFLLVTGWLLWWWLSNRDQAPTEIPIVNNTPPGIEVPATLPAGSTGLAPTGSSTADEPDLQSTLKAIAFTFAERFGSYSNEVHFSNLDDLADLMTVRMKAWVENYKAGQQDQETGEYYGVSTKAVSATINNFDESLRQAEVEVNTQRQESRVSSSNPRVFYQRLKLLIMEVDGAWKIDSAEWQ